MNKNTPKPKKLNNVDLMNNALKMIEDLGYHIKDKSFSDCYFLFEGDDNSICHFHIKEIPGFIFALWNTKSRFDKIEDQIKNNGIGSTWADNLDISPLSELVFFTQYEKEVDKFKPSRSGFVTGLYRTAWLDENDKIVEEWHNYELKGILYYMKKHYIKSYCYAQNQARYIWEDISFIKAFEIYIKEGIYRWKSNIQEKFNYKKQLLLATHLGKRLKAINIIIRDLGENWHPRIKIDYRRKKNVELPMLIEDLNKIDNFEDKYWKYYTINEWEVFLNNNCTEVDIEKDKDFKNRFIDLTDNILNDLDADQKLIFTNIKEINDVK